MRESLLSILRCPFCGTGLSLVENAALVRTGDGIESGVLGCECCAFPIVTGIPVMLADDRTQEAMHVMEAGRPGDALFVLLDVDGDRASALTALLERGPEATYRDALAILSCDAEGHYLLHRFSDPTYLTAEALLRVLGRDPSIGAGRVLDVCGGAGHLTRVLAQQRPPDGALVADLHFWKLWLAGQFTSPGCEPICCDANQPLPFAPGGFSLVVIADAFPYIWHKRLLAEELTRLARPDGVVVMSHLHSALGENVSAGDTLTPAAYRNLFAALAPRLFSDARLLSDMVDQGVIDLTRDVAPAALGNEPSLTLVATKRADLFRCYTLPETSDVRGELRVNPLYRVERRGATSVLTLIFPTPEYEQEFVECRRYLPDQLIIDADLTGSIDPQTLGAAGAELRRRRIVIDAPPRYC